MFLLLLKYVVKAYFSRIVIFKRVDFFLTLFFSHIRKFRVVKFFNREESNKNKADKKQ